MADLIRKQVVFNPEDPDQRMLLEHAAGRTNFSAYIKRLIQRDREGSYGAAQPVVNLTEALDYSVEGFI